MDIQKVLKDFYKLDNCSCTSLEGYDSINFKVECTAGTFILKQYTYSEEAFELLMGENKILESLSTLDAYNFPISIETLNKDKIVVKEKTMYRLLSFVEGAFLGNVDHTPELLHSFGAFLAKMDVVTAPIYDSAIVSKETHWDLKHFKSNYKFLEYIPNPKDRSLVDYFFLQFDEHIPPISYQLRKGIIHNDGNDWNVLTAHGKVTGIIDFGDMCHTWLINEMAVALSYVMMGKKFPLEIASHLI